MVRLDRITTTGGDKGETSLGDGARIRKDSLRIEAIGAVDEANAAIGLVALHVEQAPSLVAFLRCIQNDLFDLGADLCVPGDQGQKLRLPHHPTTRLDAEIEALNAPLPPLRSFILPGGGPAATHAHMARTITRRAERRAVALMAQEALNPEILRYLNRLSDYLFVLARHLGQGNEILWTPRPPS